MKSETPICITVDFETAVIMRRPDYPPVPHGVAIKEWGKKSRYYSWAHPVANNCTKAQGYAAVREVWLRAKKSEVCLLFQNGKFDLDVAEVHCKVPRLHWSKYHELQFLLFLNNPHSHNLQLKSQAKELLGIDPEEKIDATEWLKAEAKRTKIDPRPWLEGRAPGEHVKPEHVKWYAMSGFLPGDMAGTLAIGDVDRTEKLFRYLYPKIVERGMLRAYNRERELMPILLENEREGIRVDLEMLQEHEKGYTSALQKADDWLRKRLNRPDMNVNSDDEFGLALAENNLVDDDAWVWTKGGKNTAPKRSVSKKNLTPDMINDPKVAQVYTYRNKLSTAMVTFMRPWIRQAIATGGHIHTTWKQVKSTDHGDAGAATARLSSSPNFQNIPKKMNTGNDGFVHPKFLKVPELPSMRLYLLPDEGQVWIHRDYSQQELRILAHFEDGPLLAAYQANPKLDVHTIVDEGIRTFVHKIFERTKVKGFVFQKIYGGGIPALTKALGCDRMTLDLVLDALYKVLPGYEELNKNIQTEAKNGNPIVTWGGREYYVEPARYVPEYKRFMDFFYKLLNYLIQGSAADCTKEAIIRYHNDPRRKARLLLSVHDELNASAPADRVAEEMQILKECMESVGSTSVMRYTNEIPFDLPMLSEGKTGERWGLTKKYEEAA
jgi:DNA polymerase I-like protein with 3'-5' exonuclease and polymerase domains